MSSTELTVRQTADTARRFAVAWRNRARPIIRPVGVLDRHPTGYRFQYLQDVGVSVAGFRPFIGFPNLGAVYESSRLWPFFDLRVMDPKRPDFPEYVRWLGLTPEASRLEILSRSGGEQKGDSVSLAESPTVANDGATDCVFLVRGARFAVQQYDTAMAADALRANDDLVFIEDNENPVNPNALFVATPNGERIGWVPDLLIHYAQLLRAAGGTVTVLQNNGERAPWHARLLVRMSGRVDPKTSIFTGGVWPSLQMG